MSTEHAPPTPADPRRARRRVALAGSPGRWILDATPATRVADVAELLARRRGSRGAPIVLVDDRPLDPLDEVATSVPDGAEIAVRHLAPPAATLELVVVGGPSAGRRWLLHDGVHLVGGGGAAAAEVAAGPIVVDDHDAADRHALLVVTGSAVEVVDLAGGPTVADGAAVGPGRRARVRRELRVGRTELIVRAAVDGGAGPWPDGTRCFHRPPPPVPPPDPPPVELPGPPPAPPQRPTLSLATVVVPVIGGLVLAALVAPQWALFALLGPVVAVGSWTEARWRGRRRHRRALTAHAEEVERAVAALHARRLAAEDAARHAAPPLHDLAALVRRGDAALWRRRGDAGPPRIPVGTGRTPWSPPVDGPLPTTASVDGDGPRTLAVAVAEVSALRGVPVEIELADGATVGLCGDLSLVRAVARGLVARAAVDRGPADLELVIPDDPRWDWVRWCPHHAAGDPGALVVEITDDGTPPRAARPGRAVLALAPTRSALPAACDTIVDVRADASATVELPARRCTLSVDRVDGTDEPTALDIARALARWRDPEAAPTATLPSTIGLADLRPAAADPHEVVASWRSRGPDDPVRVTLGRGTHGDVVLDLDGDGPHLLVAGTTGAGKSELLRTLVVGLALAAGPDELTLLLADFKGGSALDPCGPLPHVAGLVTDLDPVAATRTLTALSAELRRREHLLREAGATDLAAHRRTAHPRLPRLVVVIDEFASLATGRPEVLDELVEVARRGRSLGVHLVLATQHPGRSVREGIRANVDTRIALRLTDAADSRATIDLPDAADLPRSPRGRAVLRRGAGPAELFQVARVGGAAGRASAPVTLEPEGRAPAEADAGEEACGALARGLAAAWSDAGGHPVAAPWAPPLPDTLAAGDARLQGLPSAAGLRDLPAELRQEPWAWEPSAGNLLVVGGPRSGVTTSILAVVRGLARSHHHHDLHVYAVDRASGLAPLRSLPHTGALVAAHDTEVVGRLLLLLEEELASRRNDPSRPPIVVAVDGTAPLLAGLDRVDRGRGAERWAALVTEGPAHGIGWILGAVRPTEVPGPVLARCAARLVHRLTDSFDGLLVGVPPAPLAGLPPGRAVDGEGLQVQVVTGGGGSHTSAPPRRAHGSGPRPVATLPATIGIDHLPAATARPGRGLRLPVGLDRATAAPAVLDLPGGGHALVAGPAASGRSTALDVLATVAAAGGIDVVRLDGREALPADAPDPLRRDLSTPSLGVLVLVDDADLTPHEAPAWLDALLHDPPDGVHLVAAARADRLRTRYGHWVAALRAGRTGLLRHADPEVDGDLLGCRIPARSGRSGPGDDLLVLAGHVAAVVVATP